MMKCLMMNLTLAATLTLAIPGSAVEPMKKPTAAPPKPAVTDIQYYPQTSVLRVVLANGRTYTYEAVPEALAEQFAVSEQKRDFYDRQISRQFPLGPAAVAAPVKKPVPPTGKTPKTATSTAKAKSTPTKAVAVEIAKPAPKSKSAAPARKTPSPAEKPAPRPARPADA